jgi:hypothetical protein
MRNANATGGKRMDATDNWQFQFLGYRSSVGELIVLSLMTLIVGLLAEPWRRWLSRTIDLCLDKLSFGVDKWRIGRIYSLERKIRFLEEITDTQIIDTIVTNYISIHVYILFSYCLVYHDWKDGGINRDDETC